MCDVCVYEYYVHVVWCHFACIWHANCVGNCICGICVYMYRFVGVCVNVGVCMHMHVRVHVHVCVRAHTCLSVRRNRTLVRRPQVFLTNLLLENHQ